MATNRSYRSSPLVLIALGLIMPLLIVSGCATGIAGINPLDAPKTILDNPLGTDLIRIGMSKQQVTDIWSKPDQINRLASTDEWQTPKEEWVYKGRYTKIPLDKSYMFKTKYLIFDGNNLVCVGDESKCKLPDSERIKSKKER
ncbi:MAG: hypothetical protein V3S04_02225 [Candidatus Omnitrophota bacterium]